VANSCVKCHTLYGTPGIVLQYGLAVHLRQFDSLRGALVDLRINGARYGTKISVAYWVVFTLSLP
jgi:hypothetical protein